MQNLWCGSLSGLDNTYVPLYPKFKQMGSWHGHNISGFAAQIPKLWSRCLWDRNVACWTPVSMMDPLPLEAGGGGLALLALPHLSLGRGHLGWWDTISLPSFRRKANQTTQDMFSIIKAEYQSESDRSEKKCCFTSESQIKIYSLLLWHKCPLHLFTLTWGLRLTYFICPDGLHHFVKEDLSVLKRYVCQVPCMLSLIYCLPGGMLSPTGI